MGSFSREEVGCPLERDVRGLLLKTAYTFVVGYREVKLDMGWSLMLER